MRLLGRALGLAGVVAAACGGETSTDGRLPGLCVHDSRAPADCAVSWVLLDHCPLIGSASTLEAAIFAGACPSDDALASGDTAGALASQIVPATASFAPFDGLAEETYGFALVARDAICRVVAHGCTAADLRTIREIRTSIRNFGSANDCAPGTSGGCPPSQTCDAGTCKPGPGTGCHLDLVASGELPAAPKGAFAGPGLAAGDDEFFLAYSLRTNGSRLHLVRIADSGASSVSTEPLDDALCPGSTGRAGVAFSQGKGLAVFNQTDCGDGNGAGAVFAPFDAHGNIGNATAPKSSQFDQLMVSSGAVAPTPSSGSFFFAYGAIMSGEASAQLGVIEGNTFAPAHPIAFPFSDEDVPVVHVASSSQLHALLGVRSDWTASLIVSGAAPGSSTIYESPMAGTAENAHAALVAWENSVAWALAHPNAAVWNAIAAGDANPMSGKGGPADSVGLAVLRDHLLLAEGRPKAFSVSRFSGALGKLSPEPAATVSRDLPLSEYDGQAIAIAAARQRVAVAWLSESTPSSPGGWALLECAE